MNRTQKNMVEKLHSWNVYGQDLERCNTELAAAHMIEVLADENEHLRGMISSHADYVITTDRDPKIREALLKTGGHCPCQIPQDDGSSYCMCQDFRDKLLDPTFYGSCICGLYTKVKR